MRRHLLAAAFAAVLAAPEARGQAIVTDPAHTTVSKASWAKQAADMIEQLQQARRRYEMLRRTYDAISHSTNLGDIASALGGVTRTYMPEHAETVRMVGRGARLFENAGRHAEDDRLYLALPQAGAFARSGQRWMEEMERRERASANAKAFAERGMRDAQERVFQLDGAKARLEAAKDGTEVQAVHGLLTVANANLALHDHQLRQMQFTLAAEDRVERQRAEQAQKESTQSMIEDTQWAADALGGGSFGSGQAATAAAPSGW